MTRDEAIKQQVERALRENGITDFKNHSSVIKLQQRLDILRALFY